MSASVFKRTSVAVLSVGAIVGGVTLGLALVDLVGIDAEELKVAGAVGLLTSVLSLALIATKEGLGGLARVFRYVFGKSSNFGLDDGVALVVGVATLSALLAFSTEVLWLGAPPPPPPSPPKCETQFEACKQYDAGTVGCDTCKGLQTINQELERLKLEGIGAFPLWFGNAHTDNGELNGESKGVALTADQFRNWRAGLFGRTSWHTGNAYCVVGHSSIAPFKGWSRAKSNALNRQAANLRADNVAEALLAALKREGRRSKVASCHWGSYGAMVRPNARTGEHLSGADKQLFSRSVFVYGMSPKARRSTDELGLLCGELITERLKTGPLDLKCSEFAS